MAGAAGLEPSFGMAQKTIKTMRKPCYYWSERVFIVIGRDAGKCVKKQLICAECAEGSLP